MAKRSRGSENDVIYAVKQVCGLYGVDIFRMQSRVVTVRGAAGKDRPMFFGQWHDHLGTPHASGMADLLARPRVARFAYLPIIGENPNLMATIPGKVTVPLWIETKQIGNELTADQEAFRYHVEKNGEYYIMVREDVRPLIEWFKVHGVEK